MRWAVLNPPPGRRLRRMLGVLVGTWLCAACTPLPCPVGGQSSRAGVLTHLARSLTLSLSLSQAALLVTLLAVCYGAQNAQAEGIGAGSTKLKQQQGHAACVPVAWGRLLPGRMPQGPRAPGLS